MDKMYEIVHQATYRFLGIDKVYNLVMDEMYETGRLIAKFEYKTRVDVVVLVVQVVFLCLVDLYV